MKDDQPEPSEFCINLFERISEGLCLPTLKRKCSLDTEELEESHCGLLVADRGSKIEDYMSADVNQSYNSTSNLIITYALTVN